MLNKRNVTKPSKRTAAPLPSGYAGVYRADDGKRWEAYVIKRDLILLGVFESIGDAVAARRKYWRAHPAR